MCPHTIRRPTLSGELGPSHLTRLAKTDLSAGRKQIKVLQSQCLHYVLLHRL